MAHSARHEVTVDGFDRASGCEIPTSRVLLVAEDEQIQRWARKRLQASGFGVLTTDDGINALIAARRDPPDLIVLDYIVHWLDIAYLLRQLKQSPRTADIPILLLAPNAAAISLHTRQEFGAMLLITGAKGLFSMAQPQGPEVALGRD